MDKISLHSPGHSCLRRGRILGGGSVGRTTLSLLPRCNWPNHLICRHICSLYKHWGTQLGEELERWENRLRRNACSGKKATRTHRSKSIFIWKHLAFGVGPSTGEERNWVKCCQLIPSCTNLLINQSGEVVAFEFVWNEGDTGEPVC